MTDLSLATKKKKITYIASIEGVEKAEKALCRLGFGSKANFVESQLLSRTTVTKFFGRQAIQLDSFKRICDALKLKWEDIREIIEEVSAPVGQEQCSTPTELEVGQVIASKRVTVIDKHDKKIKACVELKGDISSVDNNFKLIFETILRTYSADTIVVTDIQEGSIKIFIEGSQEDIQKLASCIELGEITEINSFPVESITILNECFDDTESENKWRLVKKIKAEGARGKNLKGADLSSADLSSADLSSADLSDADLSSADLSSAILIDADLRGANLIDTYLIGAKVTNTRFGYNEGISESMKQELIERGAIFEDTLGDRSRVLV